MSFTTRCPSCGTMFRVVADQLKISEGWVRCGHCADVFDATLYLQPWTPPADEAPADASVPARDQGALHDELTAELDATVLRVKAQMASDAAAQEMVDIPAEPEEPEPSPPPPRPAALAPAPTSTEADAPDSEVSDFHAELERFAAGLDRLQAEGASKLSSGHTVAAARTDAAILEAPTPEEVLGEPPAEVGMGDDTEQVPGFVRQAQREAFWRSTGVRAVLSGLALLLVLVLAAQWAVQERDRLAAWQPELQPLLQRACDHLGCQVSPVRRLDAIVIDSTALVRRLGSFYSFDLVLKNTAPMALAVPALELSLTDIGDGVIARRVFLPEEWPDAPERLPARDSVTISFRLSLALSESTPMAGYRAVVFYP